MLSSNYLCHILALTLLLSFSCKKRKLGSHCPPNAHILSDVHDPAQLIKMDNYLMLFASAIEVQGFNIDSQAWEFLDDNIYNSNSPIWDQSEGQHWAPSIYKSFDGSLRLYHSAVENEDEHISKIAFVNINGNPPNLTYSSENDYVIKSENTSQAFAIDPAVFRDDSNRTWLVYGSHSLGIYMVELNDTSGYLQISPEDKVNDDHPDSLDSRFTHIANRDASSSNNEIEAAYIYNHPTNPYYYLFVNWGKCCEGINSSYQIRVGRSIYPTGPYIDKDSIPLVNGGGTPFMDRYGNIVGSPQFIGPGHSGIYEHNDGRFYFSHHYYDNYNDAKPSLAIWHLLWENEWPMIDTSFKVMF